MESGYSKWNRVKSSNHHTLWTRSDWNGDPITKRLRDSKLMQVTMADSYHTDLHRYIQPVRRPEREVALLALQRVRALPKAYTSLDAVKDMEEFMWDNDEVLAENLNKQMEYLEMGTLALKRSVIL